MNGVLSRWNGLSGEDAAREVQACCGSAAWARALASRRPFQSEAALVAASDEIWYGLTEQDWLEAFSKHPRIGERKAPVVASSQKSRIRKEIRPSVHRLRYGEVGCGDAGDSPRAIAQ
jgi:hypothetical protein